MSTKKTQTKNNTFYFFTVTCYKWLHLFEITDFYNEIYKWFDILNSKGIIITAYVIMPNHFHVIAFSPDTKIIMNKIIGSGKRFMAYEIIKRLNHVNKIDIVNFLKAGVGNLDRNKGKLHQVFEPSFDLKTIDTEKFLSQKINYIHKNPVAKKWNLVEDYRYYSHSSAGFYELGYHIGYKVTHWSDVFNL